MHAERDHLTHFVFPELRSRCLQRGVEFVGMDLRWGVTKEDAERAGALDVCLDEIEHCRPFFVGLLGERYGWVPPPEEIPAEIYKRAAGESSSGKEALRWYIRDDTYSPALYRLRRDRELDAMAAETLVDYWEAKGLPGAGMSITAHEILRGVFEDDYPATHGLFYFRRPGIERDMRLPEAMRAEFVEQDPRRRSKLAALKDQIRGDGRFVVREYQAQLAGFRIDPSMLPPNLDRDEREALGTGFVELEAWRAIAPALKELVEARGTVALDGVATFGDQVLEDLWQAIEAELGPVAVSRDVHAEDGLYHERFVAERARVFVGREDSIASVFSYLDAEGGSRPMIVTGAPGSGKSSLLARCVDETRRRSRAGSVIPYFIGAAPGSTDLATVLRWLWEELGRIGGGRESPPAEIDELERRFGEIVRAAVAQGPVVLFIDALNQLAAPTTVARLGWLPSVLPAGLKIVASVLPGPDLDRLRQRVLPDNVLELPDLGETERATLVGAYLEQRRKKLSPGQLAELLDTQARPDAVLPLYLSVAVEELALFGSFDALGERIRRLPPTVAELFDQVLARLDQDHGPELTANVCRWLATSRSGLLEAELLDLLAGDGPTFPKARWIRLYRSLMFYLQPVDEATGAGMLRISHEQLNRAVLRRYLAMPAPEERPSVELLQTHVELGRYFETLVRPEPTARWRTDRPRGLAELPYHLACAHRWAELESTLLDLGFAEAKSVAGMLPALIRDYSFALSAMRRSDPARLDLAGLGKMARFLRAESQTLNRAPELVFQSAANQPDGSLPNRLAVARLAAGEETRPWLRWRNKPAAVADLAMTLKCGLASAYCCATSPDAESIAVGGWGSVEIWSAQTGERIAVFTTDDAASYLRYTTSGLWLGRGEFVHSLRTLHLLDPDSGDERSLRLVTPPARSLGITADGQRLASLDADGAVNILDLESHAALGRLCPIDAVAIALSSDGRMLFTVAATGRFDAYDTLTGSVVSSLETLVAADGFAVSRDGSVLAIVRQDIVACFDASSGDFLGAIESATAAFENCDFTPDGHTLVTVARDGTLELWSPSWLDDRYGKRVPMPMPAGARSLAPDWRDAARRKSQAVMPVSACGFNAAGDALAIARPGVEIGLYAPDQIERTALLLELDVRMPVPSACGLAPDSSHYAFGTTDGRVGLFSADAPQYLPKYLRGHDATVTACAFSPDSTRLATASEDCTLIVWDVASRSKLHALRAHAAPVRTCCWTDDGPMLISGSDDGTICFWDSGSGALIERRQLPAPVTSCGYNVAQREIVVGDSKGGITWLEQARPEQFSAHLAHSDRVIMCTWTGDDSRVCSAGADGSVKVLDAATKETIALLLTAAPITAAAFHPAGRTCIVCGADGSVMSFALEEPCVVANRSSQ